MTPKPKTPRPVRCWGFVLPNGKLRKWADDRAEYVNGLVGMPGWKKVRVEIRVVERKAKP